MKYIYGPVASWRLGRSLGIDLISGAKYCSFDCIYCQLGSSTAKSLKRAKFVETAAILSELQSLPDIAINYFTFSGCGEPTLALNLGEAIREIKKHFDKKIAVLTNSSLMTEPQVRKELGLADLIIAKLDAPNEAIFQQVNAPAKGLVLGQIIGGIKKFAQEYPGKLALQIMLLAENKAYAAELAEIAKEIRPVEVQLNTPLRPSPAHGRLKTIAAAEMSQIKKLFLPLKVYSVYDVKRPETKALDEKELEKRRPPN